MSATELPESSGVIRRSSSGRMMSPGFTIDAKSELEIASAEIPLKLVTPCRSRLLLLEGCLRLLAFARVQCRQLY